MPADAHRVSNLISSILIRPLSSVVDPWEGGRRIAAGAAQNQIRPPSHAWQR